MTGPAWRSRQKPLDGRKAGAHGSDTKRYSIVIADPRSGGPEATVTGGAHGVMVGADQEGTSHA